jgi:hypothetical protein
MRHPMSLLAHEMGREPPSETHGVPLRLHNEVEFAVLRYYVAHRRDGVAVTAGPVFTEESQGFALAINQTLIQMNEGGTYNLLKAMGLSMRDPGSSPRRPTAHRRRRSRGRGCLGPCTTHRGR